MWEGRLEFSILGTENIPTITDPCNFGLLVVLEQAPERLVERLWLGHDEGSLHVGCSRHEQGGVDLPSLCFSEVPWGCFSLCCYRRWMGFFTSLELGRGDRSGLSTIRTQSHNSDRHP